ncbi:MAG: carbohydrate ABC transporter permease [Clostridiales bacterium]|nr:carbohydrate ABC transporter permease [Clostridiales bacterium]
MSEVSTLKKRKSPVYMAIIYIVCIIIAIMCILPFWVMIVNSTRSTPQIQQHALSLLPSGHLAQNIHVFQGKDFKPSVGFMNSAIISTSATILAVYFSSLTAYAISAYEWKLKGPFFSFIMGVMMIPGQVTLIGFYQMAYQLGLTNNRLMLILPAIASPMMVFFMRQYLQASLSIEIVESARIDGAGEFYTFNRIVLPIMKPAIATQAIFTFVANWNRLFEPSVLLTAKEKKVLPQMVQLLRGDIYKTEYGSIYLGLTITVLPLIIVYLILSRYIVAGVALGSVKG